jgi:hypothetical protein
MSGASEDLMKTKKSISDDVRAAIELRAYYIWEHEGRPVGRGAEHWALAEAEITSELTTKKAAVARVPEPPAPKQAVPKKAPVAKAAEKMAATPAKPSAAAKPVVVAPAKAAKAVKTKKAVKPKKAPAHKD